MQRDKTIKHTLKKEKSIKRSIIKRQLYVLYVLVIFLPILLIGGYLTINTKKIMTDQYRTRIRSDNLRVKNIMMDLTTSVHAVGNVFFSDVELEKILNLNKSRFAKTYLNDIYRNYNLFDIYKENHIEISRIELYLDTPLEYGGFKEISDEVIETSWYTQAISVPQPIWTSQSYANNMGVRDQELWYVRRIPIISTGEYAVLVIALDNNHLKSRISNNDLVTELAVNQDDLFYSEKGIKGYPLTIALDYDETYYGFSGIHRIDDQDIFVEVSTIPLASTSDKVYIVTYDYSATAQIESVYHTFILMIIIAVFVPLVIFISYTHIFSKRLLTLRHSMHKASNGDYEVTDKVRGNDELAEVFTDMEKMIQSIIKMDEEIYSAKIKQEQLSAHQQRIQYAMLASQINPHFLYNTLETIRMKALSNNDKEVAEAIKLLGKSMRHVLEHSMHTVSLESELEYIEVYLKIQHIRFGDRICYRIHVSEEVDAENYFVLPLLIQPIVENAVLHGLESRLDSGVVDIDISYEQEYLCICIKDNGKGMNEIELKNLITHMEQEHVNLEKSSIGLHNIYHRIQLFYGERYGIDIQSDEGKGTVVRLCLPKESDERKDLGILNEL